MEKTEFKLKYKTIESPNASIPVIIVAAGNSTRMNGKNKQFLSLFGVPVIAKTMLKFEKSHSISRIILVTKNEDIPLMQNICKEYNINKVTDIVEGGNNRNESVLKGFDRLSRTEKTVLIHDGARPFVTEKMIENSVNSLLLSDAVLVALKCTDTIKKTDGEGTVEGTVDREMLYLAQTPQGVNVEKYLSVCNNNDTSKFTDDASVMEYGGFKTTIVDGSRYNIKITTPEDIAIAKAFAKIEEEEEL